MNLTKEMLEQKFQMFLIQTPIRQQMLTNASFQKAHQKVNEDIKRMYQSNFYESINIHYGIRSRAEQSFTERINRRRKQIVQYQIELEDKYMKRLYRAENQKDIQDIQRDYEDSMKMIKDRQKQFDSTSFIPCIYIEAKKKKPLYGKIFQQFDRKGVAMLKATIGYRSPFSYFDKIQFNMETPPFQYFRKRNYYEFGVNWFNTTSYFGGANFFIGASTSCIPIFKGVDQRKIQTNIGFQKGRVRMQFDFAKRQPRLHQKIDQSCQKGYHIPSEKYSFRLNKTLTDTLDRGQIMTGELQQAKLQTTIPGLGKSQFFKGEYSYRKFYDIFNFSNRFKNQKLKLFIRNSNIETNFSLKAIAMKNYLVSDFIENIQVRGFQNDRTPKQSMLQAKTSVKINNYNYPFFGSIGIIPFIYGQAGVTFQKSIRKPVFLGSTGVGLSFPLGKSIQLQVLYALFQAQNRPNRQPINFQIRIGLMD